jgi:hypothetical protein
MEGLYSIVAEVVRLRGAALNSYEFSYGLVAEVVRLRSGALNSYEFSCKTV